MVCVLDLHPEIDDPAVKIRMARRIFLNIIKTKTNQRIIGKKMILLKRYVNTKIVLVISVLLSVDNILSHQGID